MIRTGRYSALAALVGCLLLPAANSSAAASVSDAELSKRSKALGQALDRAYYAAGRRIDLALYDLEELSRQKRPAAAALVKKVKQADAALRGRWTALETRREAVASRLAKLPPDAAHVLAVEVLNADRDDGGWLAVSSVRMVWPDGAVVEFPLESFRNTSVLRGYSYHVDYAADAVVARGKPNRSSTILAGFNPPVGAVGEPNLELMGLDDDKPGKTQMRLSVDGNTVFEGPNPFQDDSWTKATYALNSNHLSGSSGRGKSVGNLISSMLLLEKSIADFGSWGTRLAGSIDNAIRASRKGLVWKPVNYAPDYWKREFIRGVCYVPFEQEMNHHFQSFRHLNANLLYSYAGHYNPRTVFPATLQAVKKVGIPYAQFAMDLNRGRDNPLGMGDTARTIARVRAFRAEVMGQSGVPVNIAVDEPIFRDELATDENVLRQFWAYLDGRKSALAEGGITLPPEPKPFLQAGDDTARPLWMEWQMFKREALAAHLRGLWDALAQDGAFTFIITQDLLNDAPQKASHVTLGKTLPLLSNDLYSNGSVREAFVMDLQRNASIGRTVLTAGAGYSDRNPSRFRRSMAVGMAHSDGVLQWTDIYFGKYRDAKAFWATDADDQGRPILDSWSPAYWGIMEEEYAAMARAGRWLGGTQSMADTAVLFSERTGIAATTTARPDAYVNGVLAVYSDLLRRSRPVDAVFVESLTPDSLRRYRVMILPDARLMTKAEMGSLREWVRNGGTLITTAGTSICDEWGRRQTDFGLADLFGAHSLGPRGGFSVDGGVVMKRAADGTPSLVRNVLGKGRCYLSAEGYLSARAGEDAVSSALKGLGDPETVKTLAGLVHAGSSPPMFALETPQDGLELQVAKKNGAWVVHIVDWMDNRTVSGLRLVSRLPGKWKASYPKTGAQASMKSGVIGVRPFKVHQMLVFEPLDS